MNRDAIRMDIQWTPRQREVLDLIARGMTNAEIAERLQVSLNGAKWHVREVFAKLGVDSREEAAEYWRESQRPGTQLKGRLRGLAFAGSLRWAAIGTASLAGVAALTFAVLPFARGDSNPDPAAAAREDETATTAPIATASTVPDATPTIAATPAPAVFTQAEAEQKANEITKLLLYTMVSEPLDENTYTLSSIEYLPGVRPVAANVLDHDRQFDVPRNVWRAETTGRCPQRDQPECLPFVVVFDDATGEFQTGGLVGEFNLGTILMDQAEGPVMRSEPLFVNIGGFTFWQTVDQNVTIPRIRAADEPIYQTGNVCFSHGDSMSPYGLGSGCGPADDLQARIDGKSLYVHGDRRIDGDFQTRSIATWINGLTSPETVSLRARSTIGEIAIFEPGEVVELFGEEWRPFLVGFAGSQAVDTVEALDANGNVIGSGVHPYPESATLEP